MSWSSNKWKSKIDKIHLPIPNPVANGSISARGVSRPGWRWGPSGSSSLGQLFQEKRWFLNTQPWLPTKVRKRVALQSWINFLRKKPVLGVDRDHSRDLMVSKGRRIEEKSLFPLYQTPVLKQCSEGREVLWSLRNEQTQSGKYGLRWAFIQ